MTSFASLARELLSERVLIIANQPHPIVEIEMYLYSLEHPDPYVHKHPDQLEFGKLYFHRRGGTFKGLDLTLGTSGSYFGILIRSLQTPEGKIIEGPCRVVDYILGAYHVRNVKDLFTEAPSFETNQRGLILAGYEQPRNVEIYYGPRVGLNPKKDSSSVENPEGFFNAPYRFTINPKPQKQRSTLQKLPS